MGGLEDGALRGGNVHRRFASRYSERVADRPGPARPGPVVSLHTHAPFRVVDEAFLHRVCRRRACRRPGHSRCRECLTRTVEALGRIECEGSDLCGSDERLTDALVPAEVHRPFGLAGLCPPDAVEAERFAYRPAQLGEGARLGDHRSVEVLADLVSVS